MNPTVVDELQSAILSDWNALLEDDGSELDANNTDEQLSALEKLEKFIDCEHSYSR